jgi:glyoxylase-like metal-dependent hydrolase (beta-lactamase superfamily II)
MVARLLPPQVHVFVRDWLSANNVLLKSPAGHVLVDTGYVRHAPLTLALLASPRGLGAEPLAQVVNTHCHSDHMGGNAAVARAYGCGIAVPEGEVAAIEAWDGKALLLDYADQDAERFTPAAALRAGERHVWGDLEWEALAAPGHDMGALCFYNAEHRILISGDALWEHGFGFVMPPAIEPAALPATRVTLERLAELDVRVVIPGHGEPFADFGAALERALSRVEAFEADPLRLARHAVKVILTFALLDRRSLPLAGMADYVERVGIFREFNARFFGMPPADFAEFVIAELERAGAVRRDGGLLRPATAAAG